MKLVSYNLHYGGNTKKDMLDAELLASVYFELYERGLH